MSISSFSVYNNAGRGGDFVGANKICAVAQSIADKGWLQSSVIICDNSSEQLPMASAAVVLVEQLNKVEPDKEGKEPSFVVAGQKYKRTALINKISAWADSEQGQSMGYNVAIGNTRALACVLLWSVSHAVVPRIEVSAVSAETAIADNEAHALATKLDNAQRLTSAIALYEQGKVSREADLNKVYKRGVAQKLWLQLQAVKVHGLSHEQALKLEASPATREACKLNGKPAVKALLATLEAQPEEPKYKTLAGKTLAEWAKTMPEWAPLLNALAFGQELTVRTFLASHAPADNGTNDHGLES